MVILWLKPHIYITEMKILSIVSLNSLQLITSTNFRLSNYSFKAPWQLLDRKWPVSNLFQNTAFKGTCAQLNLWTFCTFLQRASQECFWLTKITMLCMRSNTSKHTGWKILQTGEKHCQGVTVEMAVVQLGWVLGHREQRRPPHSVLGVCTVKRKGWLVFPFLPLPKGLN